MGANITQTQTINECFSSETYGDINDWKFSVDWAQKNSVYPSLALLINTAQIGSNPFGIGNFLIFISESINTLEVWSQSSVAANYLFHLGLAVYADSSILDQAVLPFEKPAANQLRGSLETQYLLAMVLTKAPTDNLQLRENFNKLRLWCLVESVARGIKGNYQDTLLYELCTKLRLASQRVGEVYGLIPKIFNDDEDYEIVSKLLEINAEQFLLKKNLGFIADKFLKCICKVSQGLHSPYKNNPSTLFIFPGFLEPITPSSLPLGSPTNQTIVRDKDEEGVDRLSTDDDQEDVYVIDVDKSKSFQLQKLSAGSALLATIEECQFLPWSWHNLNTFEQKVIQIEVNKLLNSAKQDENYLGCLLWLAIKLGRSVRRALELTISNVAHAEWSVNLDLMQLQRIAPIRKSSWKPTEIHSQWIKPSIEINCINIPSNLQSILLGSIAGNSDAKQLWQLWHSDSGQSPIQVILNTFRKQLPRFTQGMVANILPSQIFKATQDYQLARMIASHPQTGLPPSCAYASWTNLDAHATSADEYHHSSMDNGLSEEVVLFGSKLFPVESMLIDAIHYASFKLEEIRTQNNLIDFHNNFSAYIHLMLIAATGARPVNDVFESPLQFDFDEQFVFLDEKSLTVGNKGRIVPLPKILSDYINTQYRAHLRLVSSLLVKTNFELSQEVLLLSDGKPSNRLPFIFLLSVDDTGGWKPVSSSEIHALNLFKCPLPSNLFRHRLAKYFARHGVDNEIADGFFGHAEYGSEAYGDFSERIWFEDVKSIRKTLDQAFDALNFVLIAHQPTLVLNHSLPTSLVSEKECLFGSRARAYARKKRLQKAIKVVRAEIETYLNGRSYDKLDENQMQELSHKMAVSESGIPRRDAMFRYSYLERDLEKFWKKTGQKIKITKRYIAPAIVSPFNQYAPNACAKLKQLRKTVRSILKTVNLKKILPAESTIFAVLLLTLENKLSDTKKLTQIASGKHFRIINLKKNYYIEYSSLESFERTVQPVQRMLISEGVAFFLSRLLTNSSKKADQLDLTLPLLFDPLKQDFLDFNPSQAVSTGLQLLTAVARLIDQENAISMPGILAGYLAGRVESWSLNWYDWIRLNSGHQIIIPECKDDFAVSQLNETFDTLTDELTIVKQGNLQTTQESARLFFQELRTLLVVYNENGSKLAVSRREFVRKVDGVISKWQPKVSVSICLLGLWTKNLLISHQRNKKDMYATSSILRYFNALSSKFEAIAYDQNLLGMEEDELTEFYDKLLLGTDKQGRAYVEERLFEFHRWAVKNFEIEEPDWHELLISVAVTKVRPGIILEKEYQQALLVLNKSINKNENYGRSLAFFLLLSYRFGLRSQETLGMLREDLARSNDQFVLFIRDNFIRQLKSKKSRRQVPLLFTLSKLEKEVIENYINYHESIFGSNLNAPLFFDLHTHLNKAQRQNLKAIVIKVLKQVTGNPYTNIHHARHSTANRIAYHLHRLKLAGWNSRELNLEHGAEEYLMGSACCSRRTAWGTARYLGHAIRETQFKSYLHFLGEWASQYQVLISGNITLSNLECVILLDDLPLQASLATNLLEVVRQPYVKPTPHQLLKLLRLVANGKSIDSAANATYIEPAVAEYAFNIVVYLSDALRTLDSQHMAGMDLLVKISSTALARLFEFTLARHIYHEEMKLINNAATLAFSEYKSMIGRNAQIIMYSDSHFEFIRSMLNYYDIPSDTYQILKSNKAGNRFDTVAHHYGFSLVTQKDATKKGGDFQIDPAWDPATKYHVEARCGVVFKKNSQSAVHNRYELMLLFAIYVTFTRSSMERSQFLGAPLHMPFA